jgi:PAS domain S-box-containing protein
MSMTPSLRTDLARALFEEFADGLFLFDPDTDRLVNVNAVAVRLTGFSRTQLLRFPVSYLFRHAASDNRDRLEKAARKTLVFHSQEGYLLRSAQDGVWISVNLSVSRLHVHPKTLTLITVRDVRELREAHARLAQKEAELERLMASVSACLWSVEIVGDAHRFRYCSPGVEQITGRPAIVFREGLFTWEQIIHAEDRAARRQILSRLAAGDQLQHEYRIVRPDDTICWVRESITVSQQDPGRPLRLDAVLTDVTRVKALEEQFRQAQKMEAVGRLAGGIAHDFNNLLTVIQGYGDLLVMSLPPDGIAHRQAQEMRKAAIRAADLTSQLLAFSRKAMTAPRIVDVNVVIREAQTMLARLIGEDVEMQFELSGHPRTIRVDPGQLHQVIVNLVVNARDAMPQGGRVRVCTNLVDVHNPLRWDHSEVPPGRYVELAVRDSGCGMTDDVKAHLFEPFFTTKEVGKGTGLGLSTVYGIIKQASGHIRVESTLGEGSIFRIYLPCVGQNPGPDSETVDGGTAPANGKEIVLVVEDEDSVRNLAREVLCQAGYSVVEARCGEEAIRLSRERIDLLDLVITDIVMPRIGGREVAERLTALRPDLPVLYLSGYTDDAVLRRGVQVEQAAFLAKPFTPGTLIRKVREVLDARQVER